MSIRRTVSDRLKGLASSPIKPHGTLAMAESMLNTLDRAANGVRITCTINRHCRTRIFDFPRAVFTEPVPNVPVYQSDSLNASLVCDLDAYFEQSSSPHFAISPPLRHEVAAKRKKLDSQRTGAYALLVVEELNILPPIVFDRACSSLDQVGDLDGQRTPLFNGGAENERFILAYETSDGPWPDIPRNEQTVNMVLATVRACQDSDQEIRKHVDQMCLITDDDQFVCPMSAGFFSARAESVKTLDAAAFHDTAERIRAAASRMDADLGSEHIELLVNALYWDNNKDDEFQRLHYLSLWQSFSESRRRLGYSAPSTKPINDQTVLAGSFTVAELTKYRHDVAHCWTGSINGNYLAGIYKTINELIRRKILSVIPTSCPPALADIV